MYKLHIHYYPLTSFNCIIHSQVFPDVIVNSAIQSVRVILHQGGYKSIYKMGKT